MRRPNLIDRLRMTECASQNGVRWQIKVYEADGSYRFYCTLYEPCLNPCQYNNVADTIRMGDRLVYRCLRTNITPDAKKD